MSELSIDACSKQLREKIASEATYMRLKIHQRDWWAALECLRDGGFTKRLYKNGVVCVSK